jgi:predicted secreted protein
MRYTDEDTDTSARSRSITRKFEQEINEKSKTSGFRNGTRCQMPRCPYIRTFEIWWRQPLYEKRAGIVTISYASPTKYKN